MTAPVRTVRAWRARAIVEEQVAFHGVARTPAEIRRWQLQRLNEVWRDAQSAPYYARMRRERGLPEAFGSLEEFAAGVPVLDRATVQRERCELQSQRRAPDFMRVTGGSTAQPVALASWRSELAHSERDAAMARSWYGVGGGDRLFLLWGHGHVFGRGWPGALRRAQRRLKDVLLGYKRVSAYALDAASMRDAARELRAFAPDAVIGYSTALEALADALLERPGNGAVKRPKVVIATAEAFRSAGGRERVSRAFGCPVVMEYGAVEAGILAHEHPDGGLRVMWRHHLLEGVPSIEVAGSHELLVTSLFERCTPLLRYRIGDLAPENPSLPDFPQVLSRVIGRCNDYVELADRSRVHSEVFTHALRELDGLRQFQVLQKADGELVLRAVTDGASVEPLQARARSCLARAHPLLSRIRVEAVGALPRTIAGKTRMVVREADGTGAT